MDRIVIITINIVNFFSEIFVGVLITLFTFSIINNIFIKNITNYLLTIETSI